MALGRGNGVSQAGLRFDKLFARPDAIFFVVLFFSAF